jgi:hypothetical protein
MTGTSTMADHAAALRALGYAEIDVETCHEVVAAAIGAPVDELTDLRVDTVDYPSASIATGALLRVVGAARTPAGSQPFSIFVKQLQSARVWPMLHVVPEHLRDTWTSMFPWRIEIDAFTRPLATVLPTGMRLATLYKIVEIDPDRAAIWMEDVDADPAPWPVDRYARAAFALGQLAGRRPIGSPTALGSRETNEAPGQAMRMYAGGRLLNQCVPMLGEDELWSYPPLVEALADAGESTALRRDLVACASSLEGWLDAAEALPQTYVHGDASPQNLLVPMGEPDEFVVIDWGFNSPHAVGFDLGQLLLGLANAGDIDPSTLPAIHDAIVPAYADGLATTGFDAGAHDVRRGYVLTMLARSLFTTVPLDAIAFGDEPGHEHLAARVAMARFLLDLAATV